MAARNNYEPICGELVRLYAKTHGIEQEKDLPPALWEYGRAAVIQFLGERVPDHFQQVEDDEFVFAVIDSKAHRLRFSDEDELEVEYLGPLLGGEYREWVKEGHVRSRFSHGKLPKALELAGRPERYEELRNLLRNWAED
jgi:hypothetical protein